MWDASFSSPKCTFPYPGKNIVALCFPLGTRTWSQELHRWEPRASVSPSPHWSSCSLVRCASAARSLRNTTPCSDAATKEPLCCSTGMNIMIEKGSSTFSNPFLLVWLYCGLQNWDHVSFLVLFFFKKNKTKHVDIVMLVLKDSGGER